MLHRVPALKANKGFDLMNLVASATAISAKQHHVKEPAVFRHDPASVLPLANQTAKFGSTEIEVVMVTPEMAREIRTNCHFERQRAISLSNVQRLAREMLEGRFIPGSPIYIGVLPDDSWLILNGNHTLEAVVLADMPLLLSFIRQPVADIEEAGCIYARQDVHRTRTWQDTYRARGMESLMPGFKGVEHLGAAVPYIAGNFQESFRRVRMDTRESRLAMMEAWAPYGRLYHESMQGASKPITRMLVRGAVMSVGLVTFRYAPMKAQEFWSSVAADDGLRANDTRKVLLDWLRDNSTFKGDNRVLASKAVASCWNAWCMKEDRKFIRPSTMQEFKLQGTPYGDGWKNAA